MKKESFRYAIITHGGAGSPPKDSDGPQLAALKGLELLKNGSSSLDASVMAVKILEDDPRFNAGTGSNVRQDGHRVQLDASCMTSEGKFGAVACVEQIQNPIELAKRVLLYSPHIIIGGDGAQKFAKEQNISILEPMDSLVTNSSKSHLPDCDTVGALAFDGNSFAAALSSGGLRNSLVGRIGDVPLPGCGLFCGPLGAVACTGDGEFIALKVLAKEVYTWLEQNITPKMATRKAIALFADTVDVDIGLIILTKDDFDSHSRNGMAWSQMTETN